MIRLAYSAFLLFAVSPAAVISQTLAERRCSTLPGTTIIDFSKPCDIRLTPPDKRVQRNAELNVRPEGDAVDSTDNSPRKNLFAECEAQIVANKNLQILKGKIDLLYSANPPIEVLANNKIPSSKEKAAISLWVEEQKRCSAPSIAYQKSQSAEVGAIYEKAYAEMYISAAELYQGKITYGDFAKAGVRRHLAIRERIGVLVSRAQEARAERDRMEARARELEQERQREVIAQRYEDQSRQEEIERQRRLQILMMMQQQQQGQQQYQQQREDYLDQACLNRARNQIERANCSIEKGGRQIGGALFR